MYTVSVRQKKGSYTEDVVGSFETVGEAVRFGEIVLKAFKKTSVSIMNSDCEKEFIAKHSFVDADTMPIFVPVTDKKED